jgi:23S rRNA A1618 N6-methylase RlmF
MIVPWNIIYLILGVGAVCIVPLLSRCVIGWHGWQGAFMVTVNGIDYAEAQYCPRCDAVRWKVI